MYDKLCENDSQGAIKLWEGVNRTFSSRAMTIIHGEKIYIGSKCNLLYSTSPDSSGVYYTVNNRHMSQMYTITDCFLTLLHLDPNHTR
jgi:hypothetical protein